MKFAIIAAGEGARLAAEGIAQPKPLIPLCGAPMIERLISIFHGCEAEEIVVIVNTLRPETEQTVRALSAAHPEYHLRIVVQTTPSSMHSFAALAPYLGDAPFVLTTVDTIFRPTEFAAYVEAFRHGLEAGDDGLMAVTDYIDDESPLYVGVDALHRVTGFYDKREEVPEAAATPLYISGGIYALSPNALHTLHRCMGEGQSRMRNFQRGLIADGLHLCAYPFSQILDVDHAGDIAKAEAFLQA